MIGWLLKLPGGGVLEKVADVALQRARLAAEKKISWAEAHARIACSAYELLAREALAARDVIIAETRSKAGLRTVGGRHSRPCRLATHQGCATQPAPHPRPSAITGPESRPPRATDHSKHS